MLEDHQWKFLFQLARRIVPEADGLDAAGRATMRAIIEQALSSRPPAARRQFGLVLRIRRWAPALRYAAPLDKLSPERQDAALGWFQDAPLALLRKGFWALKTMVFMGYYGRPEAAQAIGYTPSKNGNARLGRRSASKKTARAEPGTTTR